VQLLNHKKFNLFEKRALDTVYSESAGGFHDELIPDLVQRFLPKFNLDPQCKILDIGCGPGMFIKSVKALGYNNVTGVTLSTEDINACILQGFTAINASMTDLPIKDASVDFIWCRHALEHSPYPLFTLFEFQRVLKPGGQIFIEVPAPDNERAYMHEYNPNHYSILGSRMWHSLFSKAGFNLFADWIYDINIPLDNKIFAEKSFMFALKLAEI
jgi:SAM-dependent methyltransferase